MCGVFAGTGISRSSAAACLAALAHRGPDDEGLREEGSVILGHRRLAIIDPDARSRQPMVSVSGKTRITFNGEIYNYRALREGLVREGARFSTESDTEVLLEGYERHGAAYFDRLRGMWAFVIHDRTRGVLVAARDPFGIKPLYYSTVRGAVAFASELRALARAYPLAPDPRGYPAFYNLGYFIAPDTPFKDTYKLIPGEVCVWDLAERTMTS
ncbi:MAG: asparagine synthetase B, partial [Patescibacteria group bacterium]|nr:asparagine synthetase B [Patescibacteria group bacterium]